jgi:hypothetical protein
MLTVISILRQAHVARRLLVEHVGSDAYSRHYHRGWRRFIVYQKPINAKQRWQGLPNKIVEIIEINHTYLKAGNAWMKKLSSKKELTHA